MYWVPLNNKEKMHIAVIQKKKKVTSKRTHQQQKEKEKISVWQVTFFSAARDACISLPFTAVLACMLMHHLEDITSMSLGIPQLYDRWLAVAASFRAETE